MKLQPRRQPGRTDRKAAVYASEILRLRTEGYTYEAIREALADVGIELSTSALRREMRRRADHASSASSAREFATQTQANATRSAPAPPPRRLPSPPCTSGVEIAEAFFNANPSNPLLRAKETP